MDLSGKLAVFFLALFLMSACSSNESVKVREQDWREKVDMFQPIGKNQAELFEWQKTNNVPLNSFPNKSGIILETIEGDGVVCSRWHVFLSTELDSTEKIESYAVKSTGVCL